jgi:hypothetical protein
MSVDCRRAAPHHPIAVRVLVAAKPLCQPINLGPLLPDESAKLCDRRPRVLGGDAGAAAVVAAPAGGDKVRGLPEQVRRLRARHQVMDGCRVAGAAWAFELADVPEVGEHGFAKPLPSRHRVAAVAHLVTTVAAATRRRGRRARRARPRRLRSGHGAPPGACRLSRPQSGSRCVSEPLSTAPAARRPAAARRPRRRRGQPRTPALARSTTSTAFSSGRYVGAGLLRCEECRKQARTEEKARRWRAYLTVVEEDEPEEVAAYCPDCARREFEVDDR